MQSSDKQFDSVSHRENLRRLQTYVPGASFVSSSGWALAKTGHQLVQKPSGEEQVGIGVAKVLEHKLFCGPVGNYNPRFKDRTPLQKAKYTFTVGRPDEPGFRDDYDHMFANLDKIQGSIGYGNDRRNLLEPVTHTIRFSAPVFEERVSHLVYVVNMCYLTPLAYRKYPSANLAQKNLPHTWKIMTAKTRNTQKLRL